MRAKLDVTAIALSRQCQSGSASRTDSSRGELNLSTAQLLLCVSASTAESVLRFADPDFTGRKIHLLELSGVQIPGGTELRRPNRTGSKIRFVLGVEIEQRLAPFEF